MKTFVKAVVLFSIVAVAGIGLWFWGSLRYIYSTGERAGYVQKISRKGWLIKTWEGELAMVNLPGAMPEKFYFTVRDDAVAARVEATLGRRVALKYNEHKALPGTLFGDTPYFVTGIREVEAGGTGTTPSHAEQPPTSSPPK
jgi:hypothetical protein